MKIDISKYDTKYHEKGGFKDNWQEGIKTLPFTSNPTSGVDVGSGLSGTTGGFFRLLDPDTVSPIVNEENTLSQIKDYLKKKKMKDSEIEEFVNMAKDIIFVEGNVNVTDISFLRYIPFVPNDENISKKIRDKYRSGQKKLAYFLYSMVDGDFDYSQVSSTPKNIFVEVLKEALKGNISSLGNKSDEDESYYILPFIKKSFNEDLSWLMRQEASVVVHYIHLLLHFYVC